MKARESCQKENLWRSFEEKKLEEKKLECVIEDLDKIVLERFRRGEFQSCIWEIRAARRSLQTLLEKLRRVKEREYKGE